MLRSVLAAVASRTNACSCVACNAVVTLVYLFPSSNPQTNAVRSPYCATPSARVICVTAPMSPARRSARGLGRARQEREHPSAAAPRTDCSNRSARNGRATSYVERIRCSARTAECHTIAMTWAAPNRPLWPRGANRRCRRHRPAPCLLVAVLLRLRLEQLFPFLSAIRGHLASEHFACRGSIAEQGADLVGDNRHQRGTCLVIELGDEAGVAEF
jgi:hypothetical protein